MDYFTRLEKRVASLTPGTEDYDKFLEGQAFSLGCTTAQVESALRINFDTISSKGDLVDFYVEEMVFDHDTFDYTLDESIEVAYVILYNILFCLHSVHADYDDTKSLKKYLDTLHNRMYNEYSKLFDIEEEIQRMNRPNNIVPFTKRK